MQSARREYHRLHLRRELFQPSLAAAARMQEPAVSAEFWQPPRLLRAKGNRANQLQQHRNCAPSGRMENRHECKSNR